MQAEWTALGARSSSACAATALQRSAAASSARSPMRYPASVNAFTAPSLQRCADASCALAGHGMPIACQDAARSMDKETGPVLFGLSEEQR